jgi:hypothetical protein
VVAAPGELWALRYPGAHALHILERPAGAGPGEPGPHVHVRPDLSVESRIAVPEGPAHPVPLPAGNPNIDT